MDLCPLSASHLRHAVEKDPSGHHQLCEGEQPKRLSSRAAGLHKSSDCQQVLARPTGRPAICRAEVLLNLSGSGLQDTYPFRSAELRLLHLQTLREWLVDSFCKATLLPSSQASVPTRSPSPQISKHVPSAPYLLRGLSFCRQQGP